MCFSVVEWNVFIVVDDQHFEVCSAFCSGIFLLFSDKPRVSLRIVKRWHQKKLQLQDIEINTSQLIPISSPIINSDFYDRVMSRRGSLSAKKSVSQLKSVSISTIDSRLFAAGDHPKRPPRRNREKETVAFFCVSNSTRRRRSRFGNLPIQKFFGFVLFSLSRFMAFY